MDKTVFIPILTRNHNNYLKHYLRCIDELDYPKDKIVIYINTNNNDDDTVATLTSWMNKNHRSYRKVMFEHGDFSGLQKDMGWQDKDGIRLHIMSIIRQRSLDLCKSEKCDYFFPMDTDNWVEPCTLKFLISKSLPLVAPFLKDFSERTLYSNYFYRVNEWGFIGEDPNYESFNIWHRQRRCGTIPVDLVHCTYLLDCSYINKVNYYDGSNQWEFITFANSARTNGVTQYICNERMFGFVRYETIVDREDCYDLMSSKCFNDNKRVTDKDVVFLGATSKNNPNPIYAKRKIACEETWVKDIDTNKYFVVTTINDPTYHEFQQNPEKKYHFSDAEKVLYINAPDSWHSCYDRTRICLEWGMNETTSQYFWKVDDDTFINTNRFNNYEDYKNKDYTGLQYFYNNHSKLNVPGYFMHGAGYCISRRILADVLDKMPLPIKDDYVNHEDYDLGYIISNLISYAVVHSDSDIHPTINETSPETLNSGKKIDNLLLAHPVPPDKMVLLYKMYSNSGRKDLGIPIGISSSNKPEYNPDNPFNGKIVLAISSSEGEKYVNRRLAIKNTWLRDIDTRRFKPIWVIHGKDKTKGNDYFYDEKENTLYTNSEDNKENLMLKQKLFNKWFINETSCAYYWKVEDDSYLNAELFNSYDTFLQYDYTGCLLHFKNPETGLVDSQFMSGAGYAVSRKAASILSNELHGKGDVDDYSIGVVLLTDHKDVSCYNEAAIDPFSGCKKVDGLMIGHFVQAEDMESMHNYYKDGN